MKNLTFKQINLVSGGYNQVCQNHAFEKQMHADILDSAVKTGIVSGILGAGFSYAIAGTVIKAATITTTAPLSIPISLAAFTVIGAGMAVYEYKHSDMWI